MKHVLWFDEVDKEDISLVGGKGANLGEMTKAKFPVPPGFIVTAQAYFHFLDKTKLRPRIKKLLDDLNYTKTTELQQASRNVQKLIINAEIPGEIADAIVDAYLSLPTREPKTKNGKRSMISRLYDKVSPAQVPVAVRSSATAEDLPEASFAGQQATFLNVRGEANVVNAVRKAWASLFTARAIFYRNENGYDHFKVGIAVPVQRMVSSEASGVMFTVDPVSSDKNSIVVEAIYGLGEYIVGGVVTPDHYEVDKKTMQIVKKTVSRQTIYLPGVGKSKAPVPSRIRNKQKVTDEQIISVAHLGKRLEKHYYFPQDIEWAVEGGVVYIVQTRPITTLDQASVTEPDVAQNLKRMRVIGTGNPASPGIASGTVAVVRSAREISKIDEGEILVAEQTNPDYVPAMKKASAVVTQSGGRTSHAAIVSRELGTPAVVGMENALKKLKDRMEITVDGTSGVIYEGSLPEDIVRRFNYQRLASGGAERILTATKVYVNLAEVSRAEEVGKLPVDGVGLLRAEFMLADIGVHPKYVIKTRRQKSYTNELAEKIAVFCDAFGPDRPVVYRTTDFKTNEYKNLKHGAEFEAEEENPMLGFRGASRYVAEPEVFEMELEAIKIVRNKMRHKNLHVMIPFVRTPGQLIKTKKIMAGAGLLRAPSFKLWMMVEIPVNVLMLDAFLDTGIDGISIGSNDLTQLILGIDRDNSKIAHDFSELNPAVLWAVEQTIKTCHKRKVTSSVCGQAPSDYPEFVRKLVEWGVTSISVNPDAVYEVRKTISAAEKRLMRKKAR
ncbi:MAG TPA: phosphoenolpyruvate synthase [Patescibacteria group bacterium]|nr:phosphoenolpyruvate synthase [Patescibacteria group bacterium]